MLFGSWTFLLLDGQILHSAGGGVNNSFSLEREVKPVLPPSAAVWDQRRPSDHPVHVLSVCFRWNPGSTRPFSGGFGEPGAGHAPGPGALCWL